MLHEEWPLILFTLLGQAAAGLFLGVALLRERLARQGSDAMALTRRPALLAGVLLAVSLAASFLHLGSPLNAFRAMNNIGSSWLAREILLSSLFGLCWLGTVIAERSGKASLWLGRLTALVGVAAIGAMSMVYVKSLIPAWSSLYTLVAFAGAALVLGGLGLLAMLPAEARCLGTSMAAIGLVLQLGGLPVYLAKLGQGVAAAHASLDLLMGAYQSGLWLRLLFALGAGALVAVLWRGKEKPARTAYLALALGLAGELAARIIFYAIGVPIQVG